MSPEAFSELRSVQDGDERAIQLDFQRGIGSLLHVAQSTHLDIARPLGGLAAFSSALMLDVVRCVGGTAGRGVTFGGIERPLG
jgi:hypothetical protein